MKTMQKLDSCTGKRVIKVHVPCDSAMVAGWKGYRVLDGLVSRGSVLVIRLGGCDDRCVWVLLYVLLGCGED